jgi:hypothetical protein
MDQSQAERADASDNERERRRAADLRGHDRGDDNGRDLRRREPERLRDQRRQPEGIAAQPTIREFARFDP